MSAWTSLDTWIVVIGALTAGACGLLGSFMVLRRMSMMGDAISHAVLPGLAGAFLLTGSRDPVTMLLGAILVGMLTALLTQLIHRWGRVDSGAAMGVVFTSLFAIGLIMIVRAADEVDLDPGCVLYGAIELAPLDTITILGASVPRAAFMLGVIGLVDLAFVLAFYKELKITSFDPDLATALGIRSGFVHYALVALVAATAVAAFEVVGSILVVAMLIVPGATAHLLTDRLPTMLGLSVVVGAAGAALGHLAAITVPGWFGYVDTSTAGAMAAVLGVLFFGAVLLSPRHGAINRLLHRAALGVRIAGEDALGLLYRLEEVQLAGHEPEFRSSLQRAGGAGALTARLALRRLARDGLVVRGGDEQYRLTEPGRARARNLVRSHRLWETYLVKHLRLPADHVHPTAMQLEHITGEAMQERLAAQAGDPVRDPHGQEIPRGDVGS